MTDTPRLRLLAIDPSPRGFGFAVLEEPLRLVDWGLVHVGAQKNRESFRRFEDLVQLYAPDVLVVEDCADPGCRRRERARALIAEIMEYGSFFDLEVRRIAWQRVRESVGMSPDATKEEVAANVAATFPELAHRLPPHRKLWMSEDPRMSLFDALALAICADDPHRPIRRPSA